MKRFLIFLMALSACSEEKIIEYKTNQPFTQDNIEITVTDHYFKETIGEFSAGPNTKYLVIRANFKNVDQESQIVTANGDLKVITSDGKEFSYEDDGMFTDGFGGVEKLNPLTSLKTNLAYKVPSDLKGKVFWVPGPENERVYIFNL